ncbi:ferrous iron transport protein B [Hydrogenoanaerobacterium saccharovorans]|uniref:Ferrous iron transport protein B n=1 Tax=Hydrogenoanaerobacterium saccharovorans TaxID=474960 RepID=A0A1H8AEQ8_9FIRM|nr:ferrous iron transport protein B [Hydrogenoanaerobacterium saccharovorans]RPF47980.1 ferrous iron transport protein B [Hydrogenoanaerobacterium saccharovorans]SEM69332.1 ferrous iron transport protein B [Hydrogenoanaerobacterium saccharovorans]
MSYTIALAGNPNCGKTTLFNELTGSNQYVGNWAGVTVEKKEGKTVHNGVELLVNDLPGIYSLSPYTMEEVCARDYIMNDDPDVIIDIVDGTNIERNLYLTIQLMELGRPMIIAMNMMDDVVQKGEHIDCEMLGKLLGVPVIPIVARKGEGLKQLMDEAVRIVTSGEQQHYQIKYDYNTQNALNDILLILLENKSTSDHHIQFYASKLLEADSSIADLLKLTDSQRKRIEDVILRYEATSQYGDRDTMLADARYKYITELVGKTVTKNTTPGYLTKSDKIDRIVTNRVLALPIFLLVMFLMFSVVFGPIGEGLKAAVEWLINGLITPAVERILISADAPAWTFSLILDAVIGGVGGILTFLPQIMLLFLFLSILEDSGYMARAAFIMDRLLRKLGLTGKSFIPMLMGFGCTTPAVMAARTMENDKDRKLTIMLTPFMSCGARLPIYALFAGIFFEEHQGLVVFSMYLLGIVVAIVVGLILKHTLFKGNAAPFVMELPTYRMPTLKSTMLHMWDKCKGFLVKAGTVIFSMSILVWIMQNFSFSLNMVEDSSISMFGQIGAFIAPVFIPLGFGTWQAAVALLSGIVAKEAVVTTMSVLYGAGGLALQAVLATQFTPLSAYAFMVFSLLYMPCIAAFVSIRREMNSLKWALATVLMETGVAYVVALLVYQIGSLFVR